MSTDRSHSFLSPVPDEQELTLAARYGLVTRSLPKALLLLGIAMAVAWLPLLLLTLIEGTATGVGVTITFFNDHMPHGRYLLALPIVLLMDVAVARRMTLAIENLQTSGLVLPADSDRLRHAVESVGKAWRSKIALAVIVVLSYSAAPAAMHFGREVAISNWMFNGTAQDAGVSLAGAWNFFVSAPLLRALVLRALWKLSVWAWFLGRLSRAQLHLTALHPDCRCGLRFLGTSQLAFTPLACAIGVQFGCVVAFAVRFEGQTLVGFHVIAAAFLALVTLLVLGPALVFTRMAWLAKVRAAQSFSAWSARAAAFMSERLLDPQADDLTDELGSSRISSLTDASALFDRALATQPVPLGVREVAVVVIATAASALVPLSTLLPIKEILKVLAGILL